MYVVCSCFWFTALWNNLLIYIQKISTQKIKVTNYQAFVLLCVGGWPKKESSWPFTVATLYTFGLWFNAFFNMHNLPEDLYLVYSLADNKHFDLPPVTTYDRLSFCYGVDFFYYSGEQTPENLHVFFHQFLAETESQWCVQTRPGSSVA